MVIITNLAEDRTGLDSNPRVATKSYFSIFRRTGNGTFIFSIKNAKILILP